MSNLKQRTALFKGLTAHFSLSELHDMCFDLGLNHEDIPGNTRSAFARELILYCERRCTVAALLDVCRRDRPQVIWPDADEVEFPPATIARMLRPQLSAQQQAQAEPLAALLAPLLRDPAQAAQIEGLLRAHTVLGPVLCDLAGYHVTLGGTVLQFGSDNQVGEITMRDIAGGNIVHLTINITTRD